MCMSKYTSSNVAERMATLQECLVYSAFWHMVIVHIIIITSMRFDWVKQYRIVVFLTRYALIYIL